MKILPNSNRKRFLLQPFYKTHIHKPVFNPPLRGHWAGGAQPNPRQCGGTRRVQKGLRGPEAVPVLPLLSGNGWRQECLWNRNQLLHPDGAQETLSKDLPIAHQTTPSDSEVFIMGWISLIDLLKADNEPYVFVSLCTLQKDEFENSFFIYPKVVLKQRKTSSLLKRRFIHKQTSIFNNCPAN